MTKPQTVHFSFASVILSYQCKNPNFNLSLSFIRLQRFFFISS